MATLKDVARLAGVNATTVSRVLRDQGRVSAETRQRIMAAVTQLNYQPNAAARSLRTHTTHMIGLIVADIQNPIYTQIMEGAEETAYRHGYCVLLINNVSCNTPKSNGTRRQDMLPLLLTQRRIDGVIVADVDLDAAILNEFTENNRPVVLINRTGNGQIPYVLADDFTGAYMAAKHLIDLGHRSIGYLAGPLFMEPAVTRLRGFRQALHDNGIAYKQENLAEAFFNGKDAAEASRRLLTRCPQITAIATGNMIQAYYLLSEATKQGLRVPADLSIIGFHEYSQLADLVLPNITTVRMPMVDLGMRAVELLLKRIDKVYIPSETLKEPAPRLIKRGTTGAPASGQASP